MEEVKKLFRTEAMIVAGSSIVSFFIGDWTPLFSALLVLIGLDILTGLAKGWYNADLRSHTMSKGMLKKLGIGVVVIMAHFLDVTVAHVIATSELTEESKILKPLLDYIAGMPLITSFTLLFYIAMEGLSITENLAQMGVPIPNIIKKRLRVLNETVDGKEDEQN